MACKQLTIAEYNSLPDPKPAGSTTQVLCEEQCGVCCSNICSTCSWVTGTSKIAICNGVVGEDIFWGLTQEGLDQARNGYPPTWIVGRWRYDVEYRVGTYGSDPSTPGSAFTGWGWKAGYPAGSYLWVREIHRYREIQYNGYYNDDDKSSYKDVWRLYECQNGRAVEITAQAVEQQAANYECWDALGENLLATVPIGTALDRAYSFDALLFEGPGSECSTGTVTTGWSGNQQPIAFNPPSTILSCTQRECKDTLSKTDCEAGGGIWHPGLACGDVSC